MTFFRNHRTVRAIVLSLVGILFAGGLIAQPLEAGNLQRMNDEELNEVRGQAPSEAIERVAQATRKYEMFRKMENETENDVTLSPEEVLKRRAARDELSTLFVSMPVTLISTKLSQPSVLARPETRDIISSEAFQETLKVAGSMAEMFSNF
jgi:hypothetical protein